MFVFKDYSLIVATKYKYSTVMKYSTTKVR